MASSGQGPSGPAKDYILEVEVKDVGQSYYDLYVNKGSLTFILTQSGASGRGLFMTALLGGAIYGRLTRKSFGDDMTLEQKLQAAKGSFVLKPDSIVSLQMRKFLGGHGLEIERDESGRQTWSRYTMSGKDYADLSKLLPTLDQFAKKLKE